MIMSIVTTIMSMRAESRNWLRFPDAVRREVLHR